MTTWTKQPPTEPGWYWFYGSLWKSEPQLLPTSVHTGGISASTGKQVPMYVTKNSFVYPSQDCDGLWTPIPTPELPED